MSNVRSHPKAWLVLASAALHVACGRYDVAEQHASHDETGSIDLHLELPSGEVVDAIDVHISCQGVDQHHVLDVSAGAAALSLGGLTPGECTATLTTVGVDGTDCAGSETFTVIEDDVVRVQVTLLCQGDNPNPGGGAVVIADFESHQCATDRIKKIYAVPSTLQLGSSTDVEVELHEGSTVGATQFFFRVENDATHTGEASLAAASCAASSDGCQAVTCDGIGGSTAVDPVTGLAVGRLSIVVTVEDNECRDIERIELECVQDCLCGDGVLCGVEECDDSNTANGDGCNSACELEYCGDGAVNDSGTEECDGIAGTTPSSGQQCDASCQLVPLCFCGDNDACASEQCDGTDTPPGRTCGPFCTFVPVCGNGFVEAPEQCDDGNVVMGDACSNTCALTPVCSCGDGFRCGAEQCDGADTPAGRACGPTCQLLPDEPGCMECITTGPIAEALTNDLCSPTSDPLCYAVLECYVQTGCFANGASPAECYCGVGADTDACVTSGFAPTGVCRLPMQAAKPGGTNADVVDGVFGVDTLGWAGQIMLEAQGLCPAACGF